MTFIGEVFFIATQAFITSVGGGIYWRKVFIGVRYLLQTGIYWSEVLITAGHSLERYLLKTGIYWSEVIITAGAFIGERYLLQRDIHCRGTY